MQGRRQRALYLFVLVFGWPGTAAAELGVEFGIESFRWREFEAGARLLEEGGPRYRLGATWRQQFGGGPDSVQLRGALYFGSVEYDGQACTLSGICVPFQSDAEYLGMSGEISVTRGFRRGGEVFGGGGIDTWERDIRGRGGVAGVVEQWTVFYLFGGAGARWRGAGAQYSAHAGLKYPFFTYEYAEWFDVELEPKGRISPFARFTVDFESAGKRRWGLGLYYDRYRFDRSDVERVGSVLVWQPESRQDVIGLFGTVYLN